MSLALIVCCAVLLPTASQAAKWEAIPPELLALKDNPYDPGAGALVVFNNGELRLFYQSDMWIELEVYRRIKIFNDEGKRYATVEIPYYKEDIIRDIKARAILPDGTKINLDKQQIRDVPRFTGLGRYASMAFGKAKKFTIPGVENGAIIEYQYTLKSEYFTNLESWFFQGEDYTLSSTFKATVPKEFQYSGSFVNLTEAPNATVEKWVDGRGSTYTWTVKNLPGVKDEKFSPPARTLRAGMNFVLKEFYSKWQGFIHILDDWGRVVYYFGDDYHNCMGRRGQIATVVGQLTAGIEDPAEKTARIYDYVQRNIRHVNIRGVLPNNNYSGSILAGKQADSVDMNVLLCAMLDEAGIKASVAMLAPMDGMPLNMGFTSPVQFQRLITYVPFDNGQSAWLDPVMKGTPYGVLPWQDQGMQAFVVEGNGKFHTLPKTAHMNKENRKLTLTLDPDGNITGAGMISGTGQNAIRYRSRYAYEDADEQRDRFLSRIRAQVSGADLTAFAFQDQLTCANPVELTFEFSGADYATVAGKRLLVNMAMIERMDRDVLPAVKRVNPIMLGAVNATTDEVTITIPEGYTVEHLPPIKVLRSPFGRFMAVYTKKPEGILYKRMFSITAPYISAEFYDELRTFFDHISEADQQQIVLTAAEE